jgi:hypothetical protein
MDERPFSTNTKVTQVIKTLVMTTTFDSRSVVSAVWGFQNSKQMICPSRFRIEKNV